MYHVNNPKSFVIRKLLNSIKNKIKNIFKLKKMDQLITEANFNQLKQAYIFVDKKKYIGLTVQEAHDQYKKARLENKSRKQKYQEKLLSEKKQAFIDLSINKNLAQNMLDDDCCRMAKTKAYYISFKFKEFEDFEEWINTLYTAFFDQNYKNYHHLDDDNQDV